MESSSSFLVTHEWRLLLLGDVSYRNFNQLMQLLQKDYAHIKIYKNLNTASFICAIIIHNMTKHGQQEMSSNSLNHRSKGHFVQYHRTVFYLLKSFKEKRKYTYKANTFTKYEQTCHLLLKTYANFICLTQKIS